MERKYLTPLLEQHAIILVLKAFWWETVKFICINLILSYMHGMLFLNSGPPDLVFSADEWQKIGFIFLIASPPCLIPTVWQLLLLPNIPSSVEMFGYSDHRVITVDINVAVHGGHWDTSRIYPCEDTGINKHTIAHAAPVYQMPNFSAAHCIPTGLHNTLSETCEWSGILHRWYR